jgi:hypothetical protein
MLVGFVEAPKIGFDLPLDVRGTVELCGYRQTYRESEGRARRRPSLRRKPGRCGDSLPSRGQE